jgi:outer membrane autotransporter protein
VAPRRGKIHGVMRRYWLCGATLMALSAPASAQTIDTTKSWDGANSFLSWGAPNTATYGQTITATAGQTQLRGFTFELAQLGGGTPPQFQAYVYQWNSITSRTTGSAVFASAVLTAPGTATFTAVNINTGGVVLTPGQQYVLFLTTSGISQAGSGGYKWGAVSNGSNTGGVVYLNNGANFGLLSTTGWNLRSSLDLAFIAMFGPTLLTPQLPAETSINPSNVAGGIDKFLNGGGNPSGGFQILTGLAPAQLPGVLTQLSGENGTAAQQGGVQLMNSYLSMLTDPFATNRDGSGGGGAMGFAPESSTTTANLPPAIASAHAMATKAPPLQASSAPRWDIWGAAFGGSNKTTGDAAVLGSHDVTSNIGGFAAGADYRLSRDTLVGFSLAGGATSWSLAGGLGNGRSDVFLGGLYGSQKFGAAYLSGALSYGNYSTSTTRTVTVAGTDTLHADFNAQDFGGRLEAGYRIPVPAVMLSVTPYAAVQVQSFRTPSFGETATAGSAQFALNYDGRTATAVRTELGGRVDRTWLPAEGGAFNVFGKAAWAHDDVSDPRLNVSFIGLPVASFVVNGATPAHDLALLTAGAEWRLGNGVSILAKFDGEFAERSTTYAGAARLRYTW